MGLDRLGDGVSTGENLVVPEAGRAVAGDAEERLDHLPRLDTVLFHKRLGSVGDKVKRIERLVPLLGAELGLVPGTELLSINGRPLDDFLDWEFLTADDTFELEAKLPEYLENVEELTYLLGRAWPNFYFHVSTAYDILRHNGVPLGKMDFIGRLETVPIESAGG